LEQGPRNNDEQYVVIRCRVVIFPKYEKTTTNSRIVRHFVFASVKEEDELGSSFFSCFGTSAKK
jgi:hypothetical protein